MKAIRCTKPGYLESLDLPEPEPGEDEVMLRVRRIGICGTDYHAFHGRQPFFEYPRILGHELAAEVAEDGAGFKAGQTVVPIPYLECGECPACLAGKTNCCRNIKVLGVHVDGGMRELFPVRASNVLPADGLDLEQVATVECLAIGAHAVRRAGVAAGEWTAVAGTGPIGIGVLHFARIAGARTIAIDINPDRLAHCRDVLGVDACVDAREDVVAQLREITGGDLAAAAFDATGAPPAMEAAFSYVEHGGRLVFISVVKGQLSFDDPLFHSREMTLMGSRNATRADFQQVLDALRSGAVDISPFVTHRCEFGEMIDHFEPWSDPAAGVIKAVVSL